MSRAEPRSIPPPPQLGRVVREAGIDFYYNSWRFLAANLIVGVLLIGVGLVAVATPLAFGLLPLVAVPVAGVMRMATRLVRDGHTDFGDFTEVLRRPLMPLLLAAIQCLVILVLVVDVLVGSGIDSFIGSLLQVSALYGLLIWWAYAAAAWPLLLDPERDADPVRARLRLAFVMLVAHPIRVGGVLLLAGLVLGITALLIAPVVMFSIALVWLAIARFVLPVADRVEGRQTYVLDPDAGWPPATGQ